MATTPEYPPVGESDVHACTCPARIHRPPTPPPPFRFLDLPGEIQNRIVDYFIVSSHPLRIHQPRFNRHPSPPPKPRARPRFDRPVPPTPPLSRSASAESQTKKGDEAKDLGHTRLALMLTCRKLYREHWRTYYGQNVFDVDLDTFKAFVEQIPTRCKAQIRRVRFRMPHKHHHGRIWTLLTQMKRLEEVQIVFYPPCQAEGSEYEQAIEGSKRCKRLLTFSLERTEGEEKVQESDEAKAVLEKDAEVKEQITAILDNREERRRHQARSRSRPVRSSRDGDFPANDSDV